ncbi:MAG: DUF4339 domain-containing protein [Bdellovibrionales bacterium]|nr:DUF4339 domain-containing protein [Bdellovibrionales bacterium]
MVSWYYVVGSDRVGPVSQDALKQLFLSSELTLESYVWRKGFQNWERLKDVQELKFEKEDITNPAFELPKKETLWPVDDEVTLEEKPQAKAAAKVTSVNSEKVEKSPEVTFSFDWAKVKEQEEIFFVKIGKDRKSDSDIYGPYSLVEVKESLSDKRINLQTLIFAPGMSSWTRVQDTAINSNYRGISMGAISLSEVPLIMVINYSPLPLVALVKKAGIKEGILLGAGPFTQFENKSVNASLYVGSEIKARNVQIRVNNYDKKAQSIECEFVDLNSDARKIMLNHAV